MPADLECRSRAAARSWMFNRLHARLHRPENGWDPVPAAHAASYGAGEWSRIDQALLDDLSQRIGGFAGKSVLDLGGGPGQYSAAIAQRGARVTWHDVSRTYLNMSKSRAEALGLLENIKFSLGYLDEAPRLLGERFDFVFNRICSVTKPPTTFSSDQPTREVSTRPRGLAKLDVAVLLHLSHGTSRITRTPKPDQGAARTHRGWRGDHDHRERT